MPKVGWYLSFRFRIFAVASGARRFRRRNSENFRSSQKGQKIRGLQKNKLFSCQKTQETKKILRIGLSNGNEFRSRRRFALKR
jgi:hypothetical protein